MSFAECGIARGIRRTAPTGFSHFSHFPRITRTYLLHRGCRQSAFKIWPFIKRRHMVPASQSRTTLSASGMKIYFTLTEVFIPRFIARIFSRTSKNYIKEVGALGQTFAEAKIKLKSEMNLKMEDSFICRWRKLRRSPRQLIIDRFLHSIGSPGKYARLSESNSWKFYILPGENLKIGLPRSEALF